jgi:predicted SprT family Zn-dependent metalloprotease
MEINQAGRLCGELMKQYGLADAGWTYEYSKAARFLGMTVHSHKTIRLSAPWIFKAEEACIRDVILHEIAHALVGPGCGHGYVWQQRAKQLGARPERCNSFDGPRPEKKFINYCTNHGVVGSTNSRRDYLCAKCYQTGVRNVLQRKVNLKWSYQKIAIDQAIRL